MNKRGMKQKEKHKLQKIASLKETVLLDTWILQKVATKLGHVQMAVEVALVSR